MTYQEDIELYICGALRYPLKDKEQLINMVCLHFNDVSEAIARTTVTHLFNKIRQLDDNK